MAVYPRRRDCHVRGPGPRVPNVTVVQTDNDADVTGQRLTQAHRSSDVNVINPPLIAIAVYTSRSVLSSALRVVVAIVVSS